MLENVNDHSTDFFTKVKSNKKFNTLNIRHDAYLYFAKIGVEQFKNDITELILSKNSTEDYISIISWFESGHDKELIEIMNFGSLNTSNKLDYSKIMDRLKSWFYYEKYKLDIEESVFYTSYKKNKKLSPN